MKTAKSLPIITASALISVLFLPSVIRAEMTADDVIAKMDQKLRGSTSQSRMVITIERPRFKRELVLDAWEDKNKDASFMRILMPRKDKGVTFLKSGKDLWQYIPKIGKEIKIEGSLMQDSWMGSDFTNDDLMKASSIVKDYTHAFAPAPSPDVYRIVLTPKPGAPVIWSKIMADVRKADLLPVSQEFFDHKGRAQKRMEFFDVQRMGGRDIPTRMVMYTVRNGRTTSSTSMRYLKLSFDIGIPAHIFSKSNLRK